MNEFKDINDVKDHMGEHNLRDWQIRAARGLLADFEEGRVAMTGPIVRTLTFVSKDDEEGVNKEIEGAHADDVVTAFNVIWERRPE